MALDAELELAYRNTVYKVTQFTIDIRIDKHSYPLDKLLIQNNELTWTFITPYNPGTLLTEEQNLARFEELRKVIGSYHYFEGEGVGEDGKWLPEKSFLILGINKEQAINLGNMFNQNAIVFGKVNEPAELLILI
jgi:hypothetical protein